MIWVKFKLNKLSQVRSSCGGGGRERCQFISGRLKSPRSTSLMLPTQRYKTEVTMLWDVWGRDCGRTYTNKRGERGIFYFYCNISVLISVEVTWERTELETAIMTLPPTEPLSLNNRGERGNIIFLLQYFCINICGGYVGED